jgi:hypothetical protein
VETGSLEPALTGAPLASREEGDPVMADITYVGLVLTFFGLSWLFVRLCERL